MPRTKITKEETDHLTRFGIELQKRLDAGKLGYTDLSRLTDESVSVGYISDILRAARGDSQKFFRLGRAKVIGIARALEWPVDEALALAGLGAMTKPATPTARRKRHDPLEEALLLGLSRKIEKDGLSEAGEREMRELLRRSSVEDE